MLKAKLGFGMMRLPLIDPEDTFRGFWRTPIDGKTRFS